MNDMIPKISIIVPVYKVEKYLHRCIDSILAQTFINFECILIDDGSPDNCPAICDEYAEKDNRVIVIHQENKGVSAARNAGLDIARGEWIGFVDSDDWCDTGMFEFLLDNAEKHQADVSICGHRSIYQGSNVNNIPEHIELIMNGSEAVINLCSGRLIARSNRYITAHNFAKLINNKLFLDNNGKIRYDEAIQYSEDRLLLFSLLKRGKKIIYSSLVYYNYNNREDSVTMRREAMGLTTESISIFEVHKKMLQMEENKKIQYRILANMCLIAVSTCFCHLKGNGFKYDDNFLYLKNIVKKNIIYVFMLGTIKQKISSCLLFFPFPYYIYYKLRSKK
jgi:glycosyltransferase involved in cell wall biosynthesis